MVSDGKEYRDIAKRRQLLIDKILPCSLFIFSDAQFAMICRQHVLVELIKCPETAKVPAESNYVLADLLCDCRHRDVSAVAGIARDSNAPGAISLCACERDDCKSA